MSSFQPLSSNRMNAQQHDDCFPEYIYNTISSSNWINQTANIGGDESKADNEQIFGKILRQIDDYLASSTEICNNSAWNNDRNCQQQSIEDVIRILIDFLGEFLLFLSSIIECKEFYSQYQLQKIADVAERIHQLRSTLLIQINNTNESMTNSPILDIPSISLILHELASFIRCLSKEQQRIETITEHPHTTMFTQLLDRLEKTIKTCLDCVSANCNPQTLGRSMPIMFPSPYVIDNSILANGYSLPCNRSNMCIPWSLLEQIKNSNEKDQIFGLMFGIKDENIRRKLGYGTGKHRSSRRRKQKYRHNDRLNEESNFDRNRKWSTSSTDDQMPVRSKISVASTKEKFKNSKQKGTRENNERLSTNSRISQRKSIASRPGSSRNISQQQSTIHSKQSSPLSRTNYDINEPINLHSIHDRLTVSDSTGRTNPHVVSSHTRQLPLTSMLDHSDSPRISSHLIQQEQQSHIYKEDDDRSARSLSFQSYGYRTPSKTTIKVSRESSQSLSAVRSKSIDTQQSNRSRQVPSINDVREKKSTSSFKGSINQNPSSYQTHTDNIDSTITLMSHDQSKHNGSISNKSWEQRLSSPLSITSSRHINSAQLKQNIISPKSTKQLSINETTTDFNFDNDSEHQMSHLASFLNEPNDHISPMHIIEGPQSAEGEENTIHSSIINHQKDISTPHFSPINTYRQQSTSATSNSDDSPLFPQTKKHSSRSMTNKKRTFYNQETSIQADQQGYFKKFMNCFRRKIVNRVDRFQH